MDHIASFQRTIARLRSPVFVVATANDVSGLPPELLRRGRLDDLFFVDAVMLKFNVTSSPVATSSSNEITRASLNHDAPTKALWRSTRMVCLRTQAT